MTAGEAYDVALVEHRRRGVRRLAVAGWALSATVAGWIDGPSVGEVVIRRRTDGAELHRTDAGDAEACALLLEHLRDQLATLSVTEFEEAWALRPRPCG